MKNLFLILSAFTLLSCAPSIQSNITKTYPALNPEEKIFIYSNQEYQNTNNGQHDYIGTFSVGDAGATVNCGYDRMLGIVKDSAKVFGANTIIITKHLKPDFISSCHRFDAILLRNTNYTSYQPSVTPITNITKPTNAKKWWFGLNEGISIRTVKNNATDEYSKTIFSKLSTGNYFTLQGIYMFNKHGIGLRYGNQYYDATIPNSYIKFSDGRPTEAGLLNTSQQVNFYGISYNFRNSINPKNHLYFTTSLGIINYKGITQIYTNIIETSKSAGIQHEFGIDTKIGKHLFANFNASVANSNFYTIDTYDGLNTYTTKLDANNFINISSVNFQIGVKYNL